MRVKRYEWVMVSFPDRTSQEIRNEVKGIFSNPSSSVDRKFSKLEHLLKTVDKKLMFRLIASLATCSFSELFTNALLEKWFAYEYPAYRMITARFSSNNYFLTELAYDTDDDVRILVADNENTPQKPY